MKNLIILFCCVIMAHFATAQEQKSYVKTVDVENSSSILLNIDIPAAVKDWDGDKLRILVDVVHESGVSSEVLESLMQIGRYEVMTGKSNNEFIIKMPGLNNEIVMGDKMINEAISLIVFAPKGVKVETSLESAIGTRITKSGTFNEAIEVQFEFNIPFMASFIGESASEIQQAPTGGLQTKVDEKSIELQTFVSDMALMQQELENAYKDEMTPEDHETVNALLMAIEQKNQDLQTLINELSNLQTQLSDTYGKQK